MVAWREGAWWPTSSSKGGERQVAVEASRPDSPRRAEGSGRVWLERGPLRATMLAARPAHLVLPAAARRACPEGGRTIRLNPWSPSSPRRTRRAPTVEQRDLVLEGGRRGDALAALAAAL
eukprot:535628-Pyramimonas_sp.AAC.1